jgi:hypothetical protein
VRAAAAITADVGVTDRISFSRALLYAIHNHISTLGHERFRRKLAVFGPITLSIELGYVYILTEWLVDLRQRRKLHEIQTGPHPV